MSEAAKLELGFDLGFDVVNVTNLKRNSALTKNTDSGAWCRSAGEDRSRFQKSAGRREFRRPTPRSCSARCGRTGSSRAFEGKKADILWLGRQSESWWEKS